MENLPVGRQVDSFNQIYGKVIGDLPPQLPSPVPVDATTSAFMRAVIVDVPGSVNQIASNRHFIAPRPLQGTQSWKKPAFAFLPINFPTPRRERMSLKGVV